MATARSIWPPSIPWVTASPSCRGNGDGTFAAPIHFPTDPNFRTLALAVGDFNADGKPDVAVAVSSNTRVEVARSLFLPARATAHSRMGSMSRW